MRDPVYTVSLHRGRCQFLVFHQDLRRLCLGRVDLGGRHSAKKSNHVVRFHVPDVDLQGAAARQGQARKPRGLIGKFIKRVGSTSFLANAERYGTHAVSQFD